MRMLLSAVLLCSALAGCAVSGPPQVSELVSPGEGSPATAGAGTAAAQTALYAQRTLIESHSIAMGG
jgi:type IV secretory pathway TrbL component